MSAVAGPRANLLPVAAGELPLARASFGGGAALALELAHRVEALRVQLAGCDRGGDAAPGLAVVPAVAELAAPGGRDDVRERVPDARGRCHAGQSQPGRVDQQRTVVELEQLAVRGGVAAAGVALAHGERALAL